MRANAGAKLKSTIASYADAAAFMAAHRDRRTDTAKLAHNTVVRVVEGNKIGEDGYAIRLHSTDIVTFYKDGTVKLDSGGYQTVTTKARMNEILHPMGITVEQKGGTWYVREIGSATRTIKYFDGMIFQHHPDAVNRNPPAKRSRGFLNRNGSHIAFDVFLHGKEIDTVFYSPNDTIEASEVKRALIEHDGYDPAITVRKRSGKDHGSRAEVRALGRKYNRNPKLKPATYGYRINLDERGLFSADVVEDDGHELYEVKSDPDAWDEIHEVEDGWMRHARDLVGLTAYLVHLGKIARGSRILTMPEAERVWKVRPGK